MIPVDKVKEIIKKHETLEKELSSGAIEKLPIIFEQCLQNKIELKIYQQCLTAVFLRMFVIN